jgi:hypothetical protein
VRWTSTSVVFSLLSPTFSVMSTSSFDGVAISKACNKVASVSCITCNANEVPGHPLLPAPNGNNSKCWPLTSIPLWVVKNLSGQNSFGSDQTCGSQWIFAKLTRSRVLAEMW